MSEPEFTMFLVKDPEFVCDSLEKYHQLIGFLFRTSCELLEDYPEMDPSLLLVTYLVAENES